MAIRKAPLSTPATTLTPFELTKRVLDLFYWLDVQARAQHEVQRARVALTEKEFWFL